MEPEKEGVEATEVQPAPVEQEAEVVIDYKAELEKEKQEKENYKKGMLDAKEMLKGRGIISDPEELARIIDARVDEKVSTLTSNLSKSTIESTLESLASSESEKELIKFHYENSIVKSGIDPQSVRNDLENAKLLANKKAIFKESSEMKIALTHKQGIKSAPIGSSSEPDISVETVLSKEQINELKKKGWSDSKIDVLKQNLQKAKDR